MNFKPRAAALAAAIALFLFAGGCGDTFRPVVNPTFPAAPPTQTHGIALVVSEGAVGSAGTCPDGSAPPCRGTVTMIDVSGDTNIGNQMVGRGAVHATFNSGLLRAFIANASDNNVSLFSPLAPVTVPPQTVTLPDNAAPVFVHSTQADAVYVANSATNQVSIIQLTSSPISVIGSITVGVKPVALAETPDAKKLYVVNQGDATVSVIDTASRSVTRTITVGANPVWAAMHSDGTAVYVVNQDAATVSVIDTSTDQVVTTLPQAPTPALNAPRFAFFDSKLKRLYVANTGANGVQIYDATTGTAPVSMGQAQVGAAPTIMTALLSGARAYVLNSGETTGCAGEANASRVSVIDETTNTVTNCVTVGAGANWIASSLDSTKVYTTNGASKSISVIRTSDATVGATLPAPFNDPNCTAETTTCTRQRPRFVTVD